MSDQGDSGRIGFLTLPLKRYSTSDRYLVTNWDHRLTDIAHKLRQVGFKVQTMRSYGQYRLPRAHAAFIARKPTTD